MPAPMARVRLGARSTAEALVVPTALALLDLGLRFPLIRAWHTGQVLAWLVSYLLGASVWLVTVEGLRRAAVRWRVVSAALVCALSLLAGAWLVTSFVHFSQFAQYPTWSEMAFALDGGGTLTGTLGLFSPWLSLPFLLAIVFSGAAIGALAWRAVLASESAL